MTTIRHLLATAVIAASAGLAGCSDTLELNGGVFDMLGVSTKAMEASKREQKVAARPGIVMPPDMSRLPPPGSVVEPAPAPGAEWPVGPEDRERAKTAAIEEEQKRICDQSALNRAANPEAPDAQGPLGSCNPGLGERMFGSRKAEPPKQ